MDYIIHNVATVLHQMNENTNQVYTKKRPTVLYSPCLDLFKCNKKGTICEESQGKIVGSYRQYQTSLILLICQLNIWNTFS